MLSNRTDLQAVHLPLLQLLGLVGSPGKGKHANFERVRKSVNEICASLRASVFTPQVHLPSLEQRLHHAQVNHLYVRISCELTNALYNVSNAT